jgi:hypothetical protein
MIAFGADLAETLAGTMMKAKRTVEVWLSSAAILCVVVFPLAGQVRGALQTKTAEIIVDDINDARPLATALRELEKRYGWIITFEEPPIEFTADLIDVTASVRKDYDPTKAQLKILTRRAIPLRFTYKVPDQSPRSDPMSVLPALLEAYELSGNRDRFRIIQTDRIFHVVPSMSDNVQGIPTPRSSRLDVRIDLEPGERTVSQTVRAILRAVNSLTGTNVVIGTVPINLFSQTTVREGAKDESARDVLMRTLAATKRTMSWQLFCSASPNVCALNIHVVDAAR